MYPRIAKQLWAKWKAEIIAKRECEMNKEMEQKLAEWKDINGLCMVFGLTLEEMAEAAELWLERKALEEDKITSFLLPGYKVGDKLKIKMPPDWDKNIVKEDKLLTRQEAEEIVKKHFPNSFTSKHSIDFYVALGMLKLKDEKKVEQPKGFIEGIPAEDWDTIKSVETVIQHNEFVSSVIVRKLLNIINRGKP